MYIPYLDISSITLCLPAIPYHLLSNLDEVLTRFGKLRETKPQVQYVVQLWVCHWGKVNKNPYQASAIGLKLDKTCHYTITITYERRFTYQQEWSSCSWFIERLKTYPFSMKDIIS